LALSQSRLPIVLATLGSNLLALVLPLVTLQLYDRVIPGKGFASLDVLAAGLALALLLDILLRLAQGQLIAWSSARFEHEVSCSAVHAFLQAQPAAIEAVPSGVHVQRLNAVEPLRDFATYQGVVALVDLPFAFVFLGFIWYVAPPLFAVTVLFLLLAFGGAWITGMRLRAVVQDRAEVDDRRISFLLETLGAAHTIKGAAVETPIIRRYERLIEQAAAAGYRSAFMSGIAQASGNISARTLTFGVVVLGAVLVLDGQLTVGGLAACSLLAGRALQPLLRSVGVLSQLYTVSEAAKRLQAVLELPASRPSTASLREPRTGALELTGVTFGYTPDRPLIVNANLRIEPGETISLMSSSPGKSTLLRLAAGLLTPDRGTVTLGGVPLAEIAPERLARAIGYVPQNTALFRGTLMDNLTMFSSDRATIERATRLSAEIGLDAHVMRLAQGYDTVVDDEGLFLPQGVLQRLTIIRALVRSPRILLFDDANTAFDQDADLQLRRMLHRLKQEGCALVLVSHRPSLLALADRSFVLSDGSLLAAPRPALPAVTA
jgi:ATP-binding cassette subfamily C protein LapB